MLKYKNEIQINDEVLALGTENNLRETKNNQVSER